MKDLSWNAVKIDAEVTKIVAIFDDLRDLIIGDNNWDPNYSGYQSAINDALESYLEDASDEDACAIRLELRSMGYNV